MACFASGVASTMVWRQTHSLEPLCALSHSTAILETAREEEGEVTLAYTSLFAAVASLED